MRYLGGKSRIANKIGTYLESVREGREYLEPFVGAAWVLQEMSGKRTASDSNSALITMWKALQEGWVPPENITENMYASYKEAQNPTDPLTAFIGIGCSFGGKWFGGYARSAERNYCTNARNSLLRQLPKIKDVLFKDRDYRNWIPYNCLVYCDPPYQGTTGYKDKFDHEVFWSTMREWSKNNTVIISEYKAPEDFECVLEIPTKTDMRVAGKQESRIEKLFQYKE